MEKQGEREAEEKPLIKNEINIAVTHSEDKKTISFEEKLEGKNIFRESLNPYKSKLQRRLRQSYHLKRVKSWRKQSRIFIELRRRKESLVKQRRS